MRGKRAKLLRKKIYGNKSYRDRTYDLDTDFAGKAWVITDRKRRDYQELKKRHK